MKYTLQLQLFLILSEVSCVKMQIKLKFKAMSILMAGLQETQMWAVYLMGMGNEMPISVTKEDLTCIIEFLFKQLDWIDEGPVEVACSYTSLGHSILPKAVRFRAILFFCAGTTSQSLFPLFVLNYVH